MPCKEVPIQRTIGGYGECGGQAVDLGDLLPDSTLSSTTGDSNQASTQGLGHTHPPFAAAQRGLELTRAFCNPMLANTGTQQASLCFCDITNRHCFLTRHQELITELLSAFGESFVIPENVGVSSVRPKFHLCQLSAM